MKKGFSMFFESISIVQIHVSTIQIQSKTFNTFQRRRTFECLQNKFMIGHSKMSRSSFSFVFLSLSLFLSDRALIAKYTAGWMLFVVVRCEISCSNAASLACRRRKCWEGNSTNALRRETKTMPSEGWSSLTCCSRRWSSSDRDRVELSIVLPIDFDRECLRSPAHSEWESSSTGLSKTTPDRSLRDQSVLECNNEDRMLRQG